MNLHVTFYHGNNYMLKTRQIDVSYKTFTFRTTIVFATKAKGVSYLHVGS